jgi:phosphatidylserine/phosphatidylglycerophosphate/cardiolipin synthase-like enzyme
MATDQEILTALRMEGGTYGGPKLIRASIDEDKDGVPDILLHDKFVLVNGKYLTDSSSRLVFTGSANWTHNALHYNDELMLKVAGARAHAAFLDHYVKVREWAQENVNQSVGVSTMGDIDSRPNEALGPGAD